MKVVASMQALMIASSVLYAGCSKPQDPAVYNFEYYKSRPEERERKISSCVQDGGFTRQDPTCFSARAAHESQGIGSFKDLPPMGLLDDEKSGIKK